MRQRYYWILILFLLFGVSSGVFYLLHRQQEELKQIENAKILIVSKQEMKLRLIDYKGRSEERRVGKEC